MQVIDGWAGVGRRRKVEYKDASKHIVLNLVPVFVSERVEGGKNDFLSAVADGDGGDADIFSTQVLHVRASGGCCI